MLNKGKISDSLYACSILFILSTGIFIYFFWIGDYVLFFQEKQSLFVYTREYAHSFIVKPGGLLEYTGKFLTQFYANSFAGSLILTLCISLPGIILIRINRRLKEVQPLTLILMLIPSALLFIMQTRYYHMIEYNLGFILVLLYFYISIIPEKKIYKYLVLFLFPLFFYLTGAFAWVFAGIYSTYRLVYDKGIHKIQYSLLLLMIAGLSLVVSKEIVFLQPYGQLFLYPLPIISDPVHTKYFRIIVPFIVLLPLVYKAIEQIKGRILKTRIFSIIIVLIFFCIMIIGLSKLYNPQTAKVIKIEELVFKGEWEEVIKLQEKDPSLNMIGQYFYNIALSETNQLCDRLFYGSQDFGPGSLILPWGNEHLSWGAYFFYSTGLMNEAHRWAYEEMVVYGYRPQNIKLLIKTNLINGNYKMAEKYIGVLKRTLYYRSDAIKYERFLNDPESIAADPELGDKLRLKPRNNFFIQLDSQKDNLILMLNDNPGNTKAFEYLIAWFLINKDVETAVSILKDMKEIGYTRIPVHIEEAVLTYYNSKKIVPDLGGLRLSPETTMRFEQYIQSYMGIRQNPAAGKEMMKQRYGNTFWFYFHFK